ncbi:hypothetical protein, partial [Nonomuraea sp. NPDC050405]
RRRATAAGPWPYTTAASPQPDAVAGDGDAAWFDVPLRPYRTWAQRGPSSMRVWLPVSPGPCHRSEGVLGT